MTGDKQDDNGKKHKTPSETIRSYCRYCVQSRSDSAVENFTGHTVLATGAPCPYYEFRMGKKRCSVKIMRRFCLDCMGNNKAAVRECPTDDCLIHPFRLGKNPSLKGKGKSKAEMVQIRALRRPFSKENPVYFKRF
ncbi:MAG: hypothetical protein CVU54_06965 [Deltaproteobacteria bacterium HGW-Deltaproteobacteria-12]|nr:MAG: hypothetical protein CVU54_06965 [Deltaproteobacteria bacterium HGW-Deltaproteobacteria-12]